jgi:RimJ/RimL family protein N-acetyltransferase
LGDQTILARASWRENLPVLVGRSVTLREPGPQDIGALEAVLSLDDASRFGIDGPVSEYAVQSFVQRAIADRSAGRGFTYVVITVAGSEVVGLLQVRQLDPGFEAAEWECTLAVAARGSSAFLEAARLAGSLAFEEIGTHRLEARVLLQNGRANGALRKLGAVQEGLLRRSIRRHGEYLDQVLWSILKEDWGENWVPTAGRVH